MLLRKVGEDVIAIPQPSHSWLSGQMARAWGNDRFARPEPHAEFCLGAEQHDLGWLGWELAPQLDPHTGLPREFMRLPPPDHVALWTDGVRRARLYGSYPALLVSLHAETIYSRHFDFDAASPDHRRIVRSFLDDQRAFRHGVTAALQADKRLAAVTTEDVLEHNRLLVAALDWMSLQICWGVTEAARLPEVPVVGDERVELTLRPAAADEEVVVDPWPFAVERLEVRAEGRLLKGRFTSDEALQSALKRADPRLVTATLVPSENQPNEASRRAASIAPAR